MAFVDPVGRRLKTQQRLRLERATIAEANGSCMFIGRNGEQMWAMGYQMPPIYVKNSSLRVQMLYALSAPHFHEETTACQYLHAVRWPDGPVCPHCGSAERPYQLQGKAHRQGLWKCVDCREQFTVTVGTPGGRQLLLPAHCLA